MLHAVGFFSPYINLFCLFKLHSLKKLHLLILPFPQKLSQLKTPHTQNMKITKCKFLKSCTKKWRSMDRSDIPLASSIGMCCEWSFWTSLNEERVVPSDVPKGHLVVYVGECQKRYVIKVALLKHPLFQSLLDQAQELYDFTTDSRLCIPCDENMFLSVVQCATCPSPRRLSICLWPFICKVLEVSIRFNVIYLYV